MPWSVSPIGGECNGMMLSVDDRSHGWATALGLPHRAPHDPRRRT